MTPAVKLVLAGLVEQRLMQLENESAGLTKVLIELREPPATNGVDAATVPLHKPTAAPDVKTVHVTNPLANRFEQLCLQHGQVYIIAPMKPLAVGQRIKWGSPERTVEVLESAELADRDGIVVGARYFAKLVDV